MCTKHCMKPLHMKLTGLAHNGLGRPWAESTFGFESLVYACFLHSGLSYVPVQFLSNEIPVQCQYYYTYRNDMGEWRGQLTLHILPWNGWESSCYPLGCLCGYEAVVMTPWTEEPYSRKAIESLRLWQRQANLFIILRSNTSERVAGRFKLH